MSPKKKSTPEIASSRATAPLQPAATVVSALTPRSPAPLPGNDNAAWQRAHDALQAVFDKGNGILDQTRDKQRATLNSLLDTISDELTALDQEDMENHTISLQAASQQLGGGIARLQSLRDEIAQIAHIISDAAKVVSAIDGALSGLTSFLATFPVL